MITYEDGWYWWDEDQYDDSEAVVLFEEFGDYSWGDDD